MAQFFRRHLAKILLAAGLLLLLLAALRPTPLLVDSETVDIGAVARTIEEEGKTRVAARFLLSAPLAAEARRISHAPGDPVAAGETVAVLDALAAPVLDAREIAAARARVEGAAAALEAAERERQALATGAKLAAEELRRSRQLADSGLISASELDGAVAEAERSAALERSAAHRVRVARYELEVARTAPMVMWAGFVPADESLLEWTRRPADRVRTKVEAYQDYLERLPGFKERFVPMNIDEWAYARLAPCLKQALSYAWALHEMFRHSDVIKMAAYTFATSLIDWNMADAAYNVPGLLFKLYRERFGTLPVEVTGNAPQPAPRYPVGGDQPKVNAGSATYPLDVAAALTADRRALTVAVVNATESAQEMAIGFQGVDLRGHGTMWCLTGPSPEAANALGEEPQVGVTETALDAVPTRLTVAPLSVTLYEFPIA